MSLDVYLELDYQVPNFDTGLIPIREDGKIKQITRQEWDERFPGREPMVPVQEDETNVVFTANITHNLNTMADAAGLYEYLWRPEEKGITGAAELIVPLEAGLAVLENDPERFRQFNPSNGWGTYEGLVDFVEEYLAACRRYPEANVNTWR